MSLDKDKAVALLNQIMELELAGVVRYTHYALMVYGYNRIPIVEWLNKQAEEGLLHARKAGELVTLLGGHPSLAIGPGADVAGGKRTHAGDAPGIHRSARRVQADLQ